jgi:hypothetical protein
MVRFPAQGVNWLALRLFFQLPPNLFKVHRKTIRQHQLRDGFEASRLPQPNELFDRIQHK